MKRKLIPLMLILIVAGSISMQASGEEGKKNIKIAFPYQEGLSMEKEGIYSGYTYEYMMKIAQYAGWNLTFVPSKYQDVNQSLTDLMKQVETGKITIMGGMLRTEQVEDAFAYPEECYGKVFTVFLALQGNVDLNDYNFMQRKELRVAVLKQADVRNQELKEYCDSNNISYKKVLCKNEKEQKEALIQGKADVMLSVSLSLVPGTKTIAEFASRPFYFVTKKGNNRITEELDEAIRRLNKAEPHFQEQLHNKYFINKKDELYFLAEEKEYMASKKQIKALVPYQVPPYIYKDSKGEYKGIFISFVKYLEQETGLKVELCEPPGEANQLGHGVQYDIILGIVDNYDTAIAYGMITSVPLLKANVVRFYNRGFKEKDQKDLIYADASTVPTENLKPGKSKTYLAVKEALNAVNRGKADFGYGTALTVDYLLEHGKYDNVRTTGMVEQSREYGVAYGASTDRELMAITNKVIESISSEQMSSFLADATYEDGDDSLLAYINRNPSMAVAVLGCFAGLLAVCLFLMFLAKRSRKRNEMLVRASNAKGDFLSRMSHEMRTPMNAIIGMTALAFDEIQNPEAVDDYLYKINASGKFLLGLINDILDMAKIESGEFKLKPERYQYRDFMGNIKSMIEPQCKQKEIKFLYEEQGVDIPIMVDKIRFNQIFFNLLSNAVKFTPSGGQVKYHIRNLARKDGILSGDFIVEDNGIGMSQEFQENLFKPFVQETSEISEESGGTGLGLTIAKSIVDMMGGTFQVESRLGEGTRIMIHLDIPMAEESDDSEKESRSLGNFEILKGKRVLLVEDHPLNIEIAKKLLEKQGVLVYSAENGQTAVDRYQSAPEGFFQAILMDIRMPLKDGLTATKEIRAGSRLDSVSIPIIAMTANAFREDIQKTKDAGMNAYLSKPIEPKLLYRTLAEMLALTQKIGYN